MVLYENGMSIRRHVINAKNEGMRTALLLSARGLSLLPNRKRAAQQRVLLVPPVPWAGSLGDEAMVTSAFGWLTTGVPCQVGVLTESPVEEWGLPEGTIQEQLGKKDGIEFLGPYFWRFLRVLRRYDRCYVVGADVLDGGHGDWGYHGLLMADLAAGAGIPSTVLGCSINASPSERALHAWQRLSKSVRVCARDPVSFRRLEKMTSAPLVQVADVAFLLSPTHDTKLVKSAIHWMKQQRGMGCTPVGLNLSSHFFKALRSANPRDFPTIGAYVKHIADTVAIIHARESGLAYVLIPHDVRGEHSDAKLCRDLLARLPEPVRERTYLLPDGVRSGEIKAVTGRLSVVITARMHLAIAALGQGTPSLCLSYQGKFEGLMELFGTPDLQIPPTVVGSEPPAALAQRFQTVIGDSPRLREKINGRLSDVRRLSLLNFSTET